MNGLAMILLTSAVSGLLYLAGCTGSQNTTTVEFPEGNCVGKVLDASGAPVRGASLYLVPEGYVPHSSGNDAAGIDSTVTDASGRFGFLVDNSGSYNLLAKGNDLYAMLPSIGINANARIELDDNTLLEPGSLSGTVQLQNINDHRSAVILFLGTTFYTTPSDSTGNFTVPALAQGMYRIRCHSMESGFAVVETTVTVASGAVTEMPRILIPRKREARIGTFTVDYDSLMMKATLAWTTDDLDMVNSFRIYCNRSQNITPVRVVADTVSSVTFDLLFSPSGAYAYQIAPLGDDGWEGPAVPGDFFVNNGVVSVSRLNPPPRTYSSPGPIDEGYHCTKYGCYIFRSSPWNDSFQIVRCDSNLTVDKEAMFQGTYVEFAGSDENGNLYAFIANVQDSVEILTKFDADLAIVSQRRFPLETGVQTLSLMAASDGSMLVYAAKGAPYWGHADADVTSAREFDADFNLVSETSFGDVRLLLQTVSYKDTITAIVASNAWTDNRLYRFDKSFIVIDIDSTFGEIIMSTPRGYAPSGLMCLAAHNLYFSVYLSDKIDETSILHFFNSKNEVVARCPFYGSYIPSLSIAEGGYIFDISGPNVVRYSIRRLLDALSR